MRAILTTVALALLVPISSCKNKDEPEAEPAPKPGELIVGSARVRMPAPVGIGTVGFLGLGVPSDDSPFADLYPATNSFHNHPDFRIVVVSRGPGFEVVFVRADTVGVFQQFRRGVVLELEERMGRDLDHALLFGATHTHSGPGRVIDGGGVFNIIADSFHPEFYDNMVNAIADGVEQAYAEAGPGRVGWTVARADEGIHDRRCEDGCETCVNGTAPLLAIEKEGVLEAIVMSYAVHGTILDIDDLHLSQDVSGGIEQAVEDRFDHPVQVQMHNAWGADMAPGSPDAPTQAGGAWHPGYDRMEQVGWAVAEEVEVAVGNLTWTDEPEIVFETHRVPIDREHIGYADGVFDYPYGGVYCGPGLESDCDPTTELPTFDDVCTPFNDEYPAPNQTEVSVGQIGGLHLVTFPGEPGTTLAQGIVDELKGYSGVEEVMFFGYAQDYLGYAITEDDWWQGGYEAAGSLWGPKQGDYLAGEIVTAFAQTYGLVKNVPEPKPVEAFGDHEYVPYTSPTATGLGTVLTEVEASYAGSDAVVVWTIAGDDPWWGPPTVFLEHADGTPVTRPNTAPIHSDGQAFAVSLAVDPSYNDGIDVPSRQFQWAYTMPLVHTITSGFPALTPGDYRLRAEIPKADGTSAELLSADFTWDG